MKMRRSLPRLSAAILGFFILTLLTAVSGFAQKSSLTRERGAVYVEDVTTDTIELTLPQAAPAYADLRADRRIAMLLGNQKVTLLAFSEKACRIRARAAHDAVVGWVGMAFLKAKDPALFDQLREAAARQKQVDELIAKKEVAIGMTPDEVIRSLGRPDEETSEVKKDSTNSSYSYVTFDRIPQRNYVRDAAGRLVQTITYIKVETGRLTVSFENGAVSAVQTTKGKPNWNNTRIVVPPIHFW